MIKSIKILNEASFKEEVLIENLQKVNIIYGANGTGKSTISKVLSDKKGEYPECFVDWADGTPLDVLAYNKDFRDRNFVENMPGIFTLGEASIEEEKIIKDKIEQLNQIEEEEKNYQKSIDKLKEKKDAEENDLMLYLWDNVYKKYPEFSDACKGFKYKKPFKDRLVECFDLFEDNVQEVDTLREKAKQLFGETPISQTLIGTINASTLFDIEKSELWKKVVVGKQDIDIAALIKKLGTSDWVSQGLQFIEDGSDVCPFCQHHTINGDFRKKLNDFFDEGYKKDVAEINYMQASYQASCDDIVYRLKVMVEGQKGMPKSFLDIIQIESLIKALNATISEIYGIMIQKTKEPSRQITLPSTKDIIEGINALIKSANDEIVKHNNLVNNFNSERDNLIKSIWQFFVKSEYVKLEAYDKLCKDIVKGVSALNMKIEDARKRSLELKTEIRKLETNMTSVKPTVTEMNKMLSGFGFTGFHIEETEEGHNQYHVVRENGELAYKTLSEGEITFLTFLYYMQLVKGSFSNSGITSSRVLVIDDPVSSLDSSVLFVVSTLIREVFTTVHEGNTNIKQVILLTHNVYFHKEVAFLDRSCKWRDDVYFWILRKNDNVSMIQPFMKDNPIKSSYDLLWHEFKNSKDIKSHVVIQNIMRRIIENYFQILGGFSPEYILERFDAPEERKICRSLLSWVNDGSHSFPDDIFVELSDEQIERQKAVFKKIFEKMNQLEHYEMMVRPVAKEGENSVSTEES